MLGSFLEHGVPLTIDGETLHAVFDSNYYEGMVRRRENLALIHEELASISGKPLAFHVRVGELPAGAIAPASAGRGDSEAPRRKAKRSPSRDVLAENPGLNRAIHDLGGRLLPGGDPAAGGGA
jgi:hypothetical protein